MMNEKQMTSRHPIGPFSVLIPTFNGCDTLGEFFAALKRQRIQPDEILVGDSMSEDGTVDICRANGATVIPIPRNTFDHGGTRTALVTKAATEVVVLFTQDAILADRDALEKLIAPLFADEHIGCVYGRQLPRKDANPIAAHLRLFNYPAISEVRSFEDRERYGLKTIFISNSFAAYKRKALASVDYFKNGLIFGEDTCTLGRLLAIGYKVGYVSEAEVYHSHNYSVLEDFRRSFDIGVLHQSENWLMATYGHAEGIGARYVWSLVNRLWNEKRYFWLADCVLRSISKFIGYKLGCTYERLPSKIRPYLSMHRAWWYRM